MPCTILPCLYIVRTFQKPISVAVLGLTAPVVITVASFRLWKLSVIRIPLPAEFLMFSFSAFTPAHGMHSGGSFCTDDSCKLHAAVSVTKSVLYDRVVSPVQTPQAWRTGRLLFVWHGWPYQDLKRSSQHSSQAHWSAQAPLHHVKVPRLEGCPIYPIRNGSPNWWRFMTDREDPSPLVCSRHVGDRASSFTLKRIFVASLF